MKPQPYNDLMKPSTVGTLNVPTIPTPAPATIVKSADRPMRVVVRNSGGANLRIAHDANSLITQASDVATHFQLAIGDEDTFILAPRQGLYAIATGAGGLLSFAASDALPLPLIERGRP